MSYLSPQFNLRMLGLHPQIFDICMPQSSNQIRFLTGLILLIIPKLVTLSMCNAGTEYAKLAFQRHFGNFSSFKILRNT